MKSLIAALLLLFAVSPSPAAALDRVAILLNEKIFEALDEPLRTYIADVEARFPVKLGIVAREWNTPEKVRATIKELHRDNAIAGVVLVGAMPMHHFFMHTSTRIPILSTTRTSTSRLSIATRTAWTTPTRARLI